MKTWQLLIVGVGVHLVFFYSIFDIYFTSPLVHGMTPHASPLPPPADRLVLFVGDGLRADKLFELDKDGQTRAPFLREIIKTLGAWGVSHTRVPTESRPGHVALIAGFYEDVSAVAKGWKENPVEFDSVFNESAFTWSWGSPDILPMFAKGATGGHVFSHCYPSAEEDFAGSDSSKLDTWVFDEVRDFFKVASENSSLNEQVKHHGIVFFLHLLGLDTNGHSHRPYSEEYLKNIQLVDSGIQDVVGMIEDFYQDHRTAYVMSADHGMTNWGSHGAGHPSETLTPLVAWGAGVRPSKPNSVHHQQQYQDNFSQKWHLEDIRRVDVEQGDVASLMSALLGIPYPVNSVGVLPVDYLDMTDQEKAETVFANMRQLLEQYQVKMELKKSTTLSATFRPFSELTASKLVDARRHISNLISKGLYRDAIDESYYLMRLALRGLNYYQTYDRLFLGISITCGFLGWMVYIFTLVVEEHTGIVKAKVKVETIGMPFWKRNSGIAAVFYAIGTVIVVLLYVQSLPWTNYLYCLIPVALWMLVCLRSDVLSQTFGYLMRPGNLLKPLTAVVGCAVGLEILVYGFFRREGLSVGLVGIGVLPWFSNGHSKDKKTLSAWTVACVLVAVFPLLPVVGRETNYNLVLFAGLLVMLIGCYFSRKFYAESMDVKRTAVLFAVQVLLIGVATLVVKSTSASISVKEGSPVVNQVISWGILAVSFVVPVLGSTNVLCRLLSIALNFMAPYILLSISHEGLFVISMCFLLVVWLLVESTFTYGSINKLVSLDFVAYRQLVGGHTRQQLVLDDVRRAFLFIYLILTGFFGTGNIASINSFDPASVYCFLTVFNPFVMGALMLWKNLIPFILVSCAFRAIHVITQVPIRALFLLVLIMSDAMALHFFFLVRDYGSWLDIGTSISHYIIVMCMIIFIMLLFGLSHFLTTFQLFPSRTHKH